MYAIVEIAGLQYKVEQDQQIYVNRLQGAEGDKVSFDRVMLTDNNGTIAVGAPVIEGLAVSATILKHVKGDKVIIFKKKRRKGYQKQTGFRQSHTQISIDAIGAGVVPKKAAKEAPVKAEAPKAEAPANDLNALTVADLREMAKAKDIAGYSTMKKAELIDALSN
mgnify:CR=1 FL=1